MGGRPCNEQHCSAHTGQHCIREPDRQIRATRALLLSPAECFGRILKLEKKQTLCHALIWLVSHDFNLKKKPFVISGL